MLSQKCQYALRAVFELSKSYGGGPVKIGNIAAAQDIPQRFLEVILGELKRGGFVESRRGSEGGYLLVRTPRTLTIGEIIRFVEGPIGPVECVTGTPGENCALYPGCAFLEMWQRVQKAVSGVYDTTTFEDLMESEAASGEEFVPCYAI